MAEVVLNAPRPHSPVSGASLEGRATVVGSTRFARRNKVGKTYPRRCEGTAKTYPWQPCGRRLAGRQSRGGPCAADAARPQGSAVANGEATHNSIGVERR